MIEFPIEFYPKAEQEIMKRLVDSKGVNIQHLGLSMLPAYGRIYSEHKLHAFNGSFHVFPIFWVGIVDNPGSTKSATMKSFYKPLESFNDEDPEAPIFTSNDTTPEGLVHALNGRSHGIYLMFDELTSFTGGIGQYKKNQDYDKSFYLSLFNGDGTSQLRVGGGRRKMTDQVVCVGGTTQPNTLQKMFKTSDLENGFFDRFLWSVQSNGYPDIISNPDYSIDKAVRDLMSSHIYEHPIKGNVYKFSKKAHQILSDWYNEERAQIGDDKTNPRYILFGKRVIYVNRFALIAELMHSRKDITEVSSDSAIRAVALDKFCNDMRMVAHDLAFPADEELQLEGTDPKALAKFLYYKNQKMTYDSLGDVLGVSKGTAYKYVNY